MDGTGDGRHRFPHDEPARGSAGTGEIHPVADPAFQRARPFGHKLEIDGHDPFPPARIEPQPVLARGHDGTSASFLMQ